MKDIIKSILEWDGDGNCKIILVALVALGETTQENLCKPTGLPLLTIKDSVRTMVRKDMPPGLKVMLGSLRTQPVLSGVSKTSNANAEDIWNYYNAKWREFGGRGLKYTPQKASKIKARLKTFTEEELMEAIDNLFNDPFMRGDNPNNRVYLGPEQVFGSDDKVSKRLAFSVKPKAKAPANTEPSGYYYFNG